MAARRFRLADAQHCRWCESDYYARSKTASQVCAAPVEHYPALAASPTESISHLLSGHSNCSCSTFCHASSTSRRHSGHGVDVVRVDAAARIIVRLEPLVGRARRHPRCAPPVRVHADVGDLHHAPHQLGHVARIGRHLEAAEHAGQGPEGRSGGRFRRRSLTEASTPPPTPTTDPLDALVSFQWKLSRFARVSEASSDVMGGATVWARWVAPLVVHRRKSVRCRPGCAWRPPDGPRPTHRGGPSCARRLYPYW